jgi:hypothetical protein
LTWDDQKAISAAAQRLNIFRRLAIDGAEFFALLPWATADYQIPFDLVAAVHTPTSDRKHFSLRQFTPQNHAEEIATFRAGARYVFGHFRKK